MNYLLGLKNMHSSYTFIHVSLITKVSFCIRKTCVFLLRVQSAYLLLTAITSWKLWEGLLQNHASCHLSASIIYHHQTQARNWGGGVEILEFWTHLSLPFPTPQTSFKPSGKSTAIPPPGHQRFPYHALPTTAYIKSHQTSPESASVSSLLNKNLH